MNRLKLTITVLVIMLAIDWFFPLAHHEGAWWQVGPAAYGLFGLIACLVLIVGAKALGSIGILQDGDET